MSAITCDRCKETTFIERKCEGCGASLCYSCAIRYDTHPFTGSIFRTVFICKQCKTNLDIVKPEIVSLNQGYDIEMKKLIDAWRTLCSDTKN